MDLDSTCPKPTVVSPSPKTKTIRVKEDWGTRPRPPTSQLGRQSWRKMNLGEPNEAMALVFPADRTSREGRPTNKDEESRKKINKSLASVE
ncbi:hypothetical protein N7462_003536 [Penicillium macrosclerotiorum]|uniref:uncharacterized protein n=1 Tax=Penicillium macrosclerotiorum TaxID=303699 RepID=UPI0025490AF0|nr:uncharacterized protein N7462_003536 [Penicillium macrosclerotiorum]KAJ5689144.1 hypothetical protein N7462_003536 [Penicillium macrosclerotiorum]